MERNRKWPGTGNETQGSVGGRKARRIGDSVPPIQSLRLKAKATAPETFSTTAGATAAADERGERITSSDKLRSLQKPAGAAGESEAVQIRVRSIRC